MSVSPKEICKPARDGLPARIVRDWTKEKLHYFKRFIDIFTPAMRKTWPERAYIDLFAGPGKCILATSKEEIDGSPLIALKVEHPFTKYIFVEKEKALLDALRDRVGRLNLKITPTYLVGDCNSMIGEIKRNVPRNALSFAFVDPTGLQIAWDSVEDLVAGRKVDILFTFMYDLGIKRNIGNLLDHTDTKIDRFLPPGLDWREYHLKCGMKPSETAKAMLEHYTVSLYKLGYKKISTEQDLIRVKNRRGRYLYSLLFASKHDLGIKFWREDIKKPFSQYRLL